MRLCRGLACQTLLGSIPVGAAVKIVDFSDGLAEDVEMEGEQ